MTDIVVIRSEEQTVDSPQFASFVRDFVADPDHSPRRARTYLDEGGDARLSRPTCDDRSIALFDDDETDALVEKADDSEESAFVVSVTGEETLDHDFNLSQEDLNRVSSSSGCRPPSSSCCSSSARSWPVSSRC